MLSVDAMMQQHQQQNLIASVLHYTLFITLFSRILCFFSKHVIMEDFSAAGIWKNNFSIFSRKISRIGWPLFLALLSYPANALWRLYSLCVTPTVVPKMCRAEVNHIWFSSLDPGQWDRFILYVEIIVM